MNVLPIKIPSLRERKEDIIPLFMHYLNNVFNIDIDVEMISDYSKYKLENHMWLGNIRELRNVAEYLSNFMRHGLDCESQLDELLIDDTFDYNNSDIGIDSIQSIYAELENRLNPHICMSILNILSSSPYKWSRSMLSDELCNRNIMISESKVKRYLLALKEFDLIQTKTGYGTYIKQLGKELIEYYNKGIN